MTMLSDAAAVFRFNLCKIACAHCNYLQRVYYALLLQPPDTLFALVLVVDFMQKSVCICCRSGPTRGVWMP